MFMMAMETLVLRKAPQEATPSGGGEANFPEHEVFRVLRQAMGLLGDVLHGDWLKHSCGDDGENAIE